MRRAGLAVAALLALAAVVSAEIPPPLTDTVSRFEELRVEAASAPVTGLLLSDGHLSLHLKSGRASAVRAGDGQHSGACGGIGPVSGNRWRRQRQRCRGGTVFGSRGTGVGREWL